MTSFRFQSRGPQGPLDFRVPRCTDQQVLAFEALVDQVSQDFGYTTKFDAEARGQYSGYALIASSKLPSMMSSALTSHPKAAAPHLDLTEYDAQGSDIANLTRMHNAATRVVEVLGQVLLYRAGLRGYQTSYQMMYCDEQRQAAAAPPEFQKVFDIMSPTWNKLQEDREASARQNVRLVAGQKLTQDELQKELQASRRQTELVQDELRRAMQIITQLQAQQARPAIAPDDKRKSDR